LGRGIYNSRCGIFGGRGITFSMAGRQDGYAGSNGDAYIYLLHPVNLDKGKWLAPLIKKQWVALATHCMLNIPYF